MRAVLTGLMLLLAAPSAEAGAWLREKKGGFLSASTTIRSFSDRLGQESSVYLESALTPKLTIGIDTNQGDNQSGHAAVFVRFPLGKPRGQNRLALEVALGGHFRGPEWAPLSKLTLSYGRSLETRWGPGWLAMDLAAEHRQGLPGPTMKLDATLGLSGLRRVQPMLQIETSRTANGALNWAIIPSVRIARKESVTWVLGLERKYAGQHSIGLKMAIWKSF